MGYYCCYNLPAVIGNGQRQYYVKYKLKTRRHQAFQSLQCTHHIMKCQMRSMDTLYYVPSRASTAPVNDGGISRDGDSSKLHHLHQPSGSSSSKARAQHTHGLPQLRDSTAVVLKEPIRRIYPANRGAAEVRDLIFCRAARGAGPSPGASGPSCALALHAVEPVSAGAAERLGHQLSSTGTRSDRQQAVRNALWNDASCGQTRRVGSGSSEANARGDRSLLGEEHPPARLCKTSLPQRSPSRPNRSSASRPQRRPLPRRWSPRTRRSRTHPRPRRPPRVHHPEPAPQEQGPCLAREARPLEAAAPAILHSPHRSCTRRAASAPTGKGQRPTLPAARTARRRERRPRRRQSRASSRPYSADVKPGGSVGVSSSNKAPEQWEPGQCNARLPGLQGARVPGPPGTMVYQGIGEHHQGTGAQDQQDNKATEHQERRDQTTRTRATG